MELNSTLIGKAEHLKVLLFEFLSRADGEKKFYSDPKYNGYVGEGDTSEVLRRRTWPEVDYWQSEDDVIEFEKPIQMMGKSKAVFKRNEYVYIGRTGPGELIVDGVEIVGADARRFNVKVSRLRVPRWWWARIRIQYVSFQDLPLSFDATLVIRTDTDRVRQLKIVGKQ